MAHADWTVYDRAEMLDTVSARVGSTQREVLIGADGMHCAACVGRIDKLLRPRVADVRIDLTSRTVQFRLDPSHTRLSSVLDALDRAGFKPQVLAQDAGLQSQKMQRRDALARIGVAVICAMQVMMLAWPSYQFGASAAVDMEPAIGQLLRWAQMVIATPAVLYAGWPFLHGAWQALAARSVNMDVPVALSILIAYLASVWRTLAGDGEIYFDTATMFVMFLLIGRFIEGRTRAQAGARLRLLAGRRQLTAQRETAGVLQTVPLGVLQTGDVLVVAPGEAVPVDGSLLDAAAELDEALLTGESHAVVHAAGERLLAGSLNLGQSPLRLCADNVGASTWLAQITQLLQRAQTQRPRFQILADRLAGAFIIVVLTLAAIAAWLWAGSGFDKSLSVALAVMVASCPCALSLAVPAANAAASSRLAALGVLPADPQAIARLTKVDTVLFDKTGTLTEARLQIVAVELLVADAGEADVLALAAALERGLAHPIARAFTDVPSRKLALEQRQVPGVGVSGIIDGHHYRIGAAQDHLQDGGDTVLTLQRNDTALARIILRSQPREDAAQLVGDLCKAGIRVELLTGDGEAAAQTLAMTLGIRSVHARQSPEQKLQHLRALQQQGRVVLAVGDGINDAPFLAAADVSAAMPQGAALTQSRADLLLIGDSLAALSAARAVALRAERRVRQNLLWAIGYNLLVLPLAMAGALSPWIAAVGMSASSLLVVANALRLGPRTQPAPVAAPACPVQPAQAH